RLSKLLCVADTIICVSKFERSLILRDFQLDPDRVVVIPNGVNITPIDSQHDPHRLLFVGRLERYKNVDKIIKALSILAEDNRFNLTVIGDGPETVGLTNLIEKLGIRSRVEMKGNLSDAELATEYQR